MNPHQTKKYLESLINYEMYPEKADASFFTLERITLLLDLLGNPHKDMKIVHVAGSKGKGSTCILTANILKEAGYRVGMYTSPHLNNHRERIQIFDSSDKYEGRNLSETIFQEAITEEKFCDVIGQIKSVIEKIDSKRMGLKNLTFFEIFTAAALYYFKQEKVDIVVLEAGLGGRLDATNIVSSLVCAITPISLEHAELLGDSVEKIAVEKAGIIKKGCKVVVSAPQQEGVREVLAQRCGGLGVKLLFVDRDFEYAITKQNFKRQVFNVNSGDGVDNSVVNYQDVRLSLAGRHQLINAVVAIGIIESLKKAGFHIPSSAVYSGMEKIFWPARFEAIKKEPLVILDGAHNPASAQALADIIQEVLPGRKVTLVLGVSDSKDKIGIAGELERIADKVIITKADHPRACDIMEEGSKEMFAEMECFNAVNIKQALMLAYEETEKEGIILITGSFFLVSEARRLLCSD